MKSTLSSLKNMFKVPDLRNKIIFTVVIIGVYRVGSWVPLPGIDFKALQSLEAASSKGGVLSFLSLFSGGALTRFAVFGLGIMPYITAEIIIQLLVVVVPKFEQWREEGATGQKKLTQTARYLTIALAIMQATGLAFVFHNGGGGFLGAGTGLNLDLIPNFTVPRVLLIVLTMTAGTAFVMWLGELITQRGIGQGMSILIFTN
ncbi:MAG: preprotein translocase subunit SecY, partial [Actinomycetota bacterium]|nr:preprotein translocase subunit SecY [Actinomycetota bacterium]